MDNMEKIVKILESNQAIIQELIGRIETLEETVDEQAETIRGLETDHGILQDEVAALTGEVEDLATDVESHQQDENA